MAVRRMDQDRKTAHGGPAGDRRSCKGGGLPEYDGQVQSSVGRPHRLDRPGSGRPAAGAPTSSAHIAGRGLRQQIAFSSRRMRIPVSKHAIKRTRRRPLCTCPVSRYSRRPQEFRVANVVYHAAFRSAGQAIQLADEARAKPLAFSALADLAEGMWCAESHFSAFRAMAEIAESPSWWPGLFFISSWARPTKRGFARSALNHRRRHPFGLTVRLSRTARWARNFWISS